MDTNKITYEDVKGYCKSRCLTIIDNDLLYELTHLKIKVLEQEPKTGYWKVVSDGYGDSAYICECSECKDTVWVYKNADRQWKYCPNCGAKMI